MEMSGQIQTPNAITPGKPLCIRCTGGWVGPKAGLKFMQMGKISLFLMETEGAGRYYI
jgi:hypothetical protein